MSLEVRPRFVRFTAVEILVIAAVYASLFVLGGTPEVALVLLPAVPVAIRLSMVRTWVDGDRLHIRNFWATHDLHRNDIAGFDVEDALGGRAWRQRTVCVFPVGHRSRRLNATTRSYRKFLPIWPRAGARTSADDMCDELNAWLRATGA